MIIMSSNKKPKKNLDNQGANVLRADGQENGDEAVEREVSQEIHVIAQEVKIVKALACNDLKQRSKQMKKLRKWLQLRSHSSFMFSQEDFMRIWKGLYYNMWYSDKPLVQEELAEQLAKLLECFEGKLELSINFFGAFLKVMCIEWFGIDQWRIDKFLMLARRMLRYTFKLLKAHNWDSDAVKIFNKHATETVLFENVSARGLTMHYLDIFFEELSKVSGGDISPDQVTLLVQPFVAFMATQKDFQLITHCRKRVFYHLLYQSDLGREYTEKYNAWKEMGFPSRHIDDLEKCEESENDEHEEGTEQDVNEIKLMDPRAGNVDVFMPILPLDAQSIISKIEFFLYKNECATKRRKLLKKLLDIFKTYQNGEFPLGIKTMPRFEDKSEKPLIKDKIQQLENLENELYGVDRKLKQLTKRKRRKLLKSLNYDDIDEGNYEQKLEKAIPKDYLMERRKKSRKEFMSGWVEEELDEHDLKVTAERKQEGVDGKENSFDFCDRKVSMKENPIPENLRDATDEPQRKQKRVDKSLEKTKKQLKRKKAQKTTDETLSEVREKNHSLTEEKPEETKVVKISDDVSDSQNLIIQKDLKVLKISDDNEQLIAKKKKKTVKSLPSTPKNEWNENLEEGEIEYFLPSRKLQIKKANANLVLNPLVKNHANNQSTPVLTNKLSSSTCTTIRTPASLKRVKIALKHNTSQNPAEYIQQIKSSPNIPYDAKKIPGKGLLKPNAMPSPINPFYKKKIGLKLLNDTI